MLEVAAGLERASEHPLASAVLASAEERGVAVSAVDGFSAVTGQGVRGTVAGQVVGVGNEALLQGLQVATAGSMQAKIEAMRGNGETVLFVAIGGKFAGMLGVADPVKGTAAEVLRELKSAGLKVLMLTGDNRMTASVVAGKLGGV